MPEQAEVVAEYILYMKEHVTEMNNPKVQLERLHQVLADMEKTPLPENWEEFEGKAKVYHIMMDLEEFLIYKKRFVESLDEKKLRIYWNKENNSKNLIGQRVKELRTERQLSQKALAEQLQLAGYEFSDLTVLRIEQGTRFVPDYEVVALAEFFHVSCEYLLGVRNEK